MLSCKNCGKDKTFFLRRPSLNKNNFITCKACGARYKLSDDYRKRDLLYILIITIFIVFLTFGLNVTLLLLIIIVSLCLQLYRMFFTKIEKIDD